MDLATGNGGTDNVSVLINNGDGTFATQVTYAAGDGPHSIFDADLNGDGYVDIACANAFGNTISILLNNGNGTFVTDSFYVTATHPRSVTAADFDNDGDLDLATANLYSASSSVLMNIGDGTFAAKVDYPLGSGPRLVFSADLNGDAYADIISANSGGDNISVLLNDGDGTFASPGAYNVGASDPYALNASDFINDGVLDLITANTIGNSLTAFTNDGNGTMSAVNMIPSGGSGPLSIAAADFNLDGNLDIATSNFFGNSVSVYFNDTASFAQNSLVIPSISVFPCELNCTAVQPVQTSLIEPIKGASIPIEVPAPFKICSVSTEGLVTENWDIVVIDDDDWDDSGFIFVLFANTFGELIPTGVTTVFNIFFGASADFPQSYFVHWDTALSTDQSRQLKYSDTLNLLIFPEFDNSADSTEIEGYVAGDFDSNGNIGILDLTAMVDKLFRGGEPACQLSSADNNGDCNGPDIADLTYLIDYIFRGGAAPKCGCL